MASNETINELLQSTDSEESIEYLNNYLAEKQKALDELSDDASELDRAHLKLDIAEALVGVGRAEECWEVAREAFDVFIENEQWEAAVQCCDVLYQSGQPASLSALGQGVWLAVTYPIDPQLSINMLGYVVDETPGKADGAAVAAIVAHYIADIRTEGEKHKSMTFVTNQLLANAAREHSGINNQEEMDAWLEKLQLLDPEIFLPRLSLVLGAIVPQDQWWFDRDALREKITD
ncbi:MAG: hypothetical protein KAJ92_01630 [Gammaproteobacteria bacterium]|nr:hypothetical protein [Gammaproteobacteria bacterium]MCK5262348.1 hypothetical protein [Gammaproteobacteria bacterium]